MKRVMDLVCQPSHLRAVRNVPCFTSQGVLELPISTQVYGKVFNSSIQRDVVLVAVPIDRRFRRLSRSEVRHLRHWGG